ncbi:response regulator [Geomesophilobacter sediminis]|uniref:Response regulator n=1 Tax=Geomesophilobacter sediminis TaxID=2798584 RepID=A0A8J7IRL0_9BACT|nr:response regulator [Geomesophilobacter sediminis]MBJ6725584.1 response regulator [Geomesophilobacter sediminis]
MSASATHVLVVDDDPFTAEMTGMILEEPEYEIILANSGMEALGILASDPEVRIVISDLNMPSINGIQLFLALRERGFSVPFVLLTGDDSPPLRLEYSMDAIIAKDEDLDVILPRTVGALLAKADSPSGT